MYFKLTCWYIHVFNMNQDVSVPTVEKFTGSYLSVSKHEAIVSEHENVDKDEKTGAGIQ